MTIDTYRHIVIHDPSTDRVCAAGTLFIEHKYIHSCGRVGHIEDVVVAEAARGRHLGKWLVEALLEEARLAGCYKCILDCEDGKAAFYEKCGLSRKQVQMAKYFHS